MSFKNHLKANLTSAASSINHVWGATAKAAGWPQDIHSQVSVQASDNGVKFEYPQEIANKVFDTEYGTVGQNPKAAMRQTSQLGSAEVKKAIYKSLSQDLSDTGLF